MASQPREQEPHTEDSSMEENPPEDDEYVDQDQEESQEVDYEEGEEVQSDPEDNDEDVEEPRKRKRSRASESVDEEMEKNEEEQRLADERTLQEAVDALEAAGEKVICVIQDVPVQYFDGKNWTLEKPKVTSVASTSTEKRSSKRSCFRIKKNIQSCGLPGHGIGLNAYKQCHVKNCRTYYRNYCGPKLTFFALPTDAIAREAWMSVVPWKDSKLPKFTFVCEAHFHPGLIFVSPGQRMKRLLAGAIPSLFESTPPCGQLPSEVMNLNLASPAASSEELQRSLEEIAGLPARNETPTKDNDLYEIGTPAKGHQECWVLGCEYRSKRYVGEKRATFKLPQKDPEELQKWLSVLPLTDGQTISKRSSICSAHFDPAMIKKSHDGRCHLLPGALPYIFDPKPSMIAPSRQRLKPLPESPATPHGVPSREYLVEQERLVLVEKLRGRKGLKKAESPITDSDEGPRPLGAKSKTVCSVQGCMTNTSNWIGPKRSVFRVPKDKELREKWLKNISLKDRPGHGKNNLNVCEAHFKKAFIVEHETRGDKRLVPSAYPTIFKKDPPKYLKQASILPVPEIIGRKMPKKKPPPKRRLRSSLPETSDHESESEVEVEDEFKRKRTRNLQKTPCFIPGCDYNSVDYEGLKRATFYMPRWDRLLMKKWMSNVLVKPGKWTKWACICQAHFDPSLISVVDGEVFLDPEAIPTIFPEVDPELVKDMPVRSLEKPKKIRKPTKRICCYKQCDYNSLDYYGPRRGLFRLPIKNEELLGKWLNGIGREGRDWVRPSTTLCAAHFDPDLITGRGSCFLLVKEAVPTIFN